MAGVKLAATLMIALLGSYGRGLGNEVDSGKVKMLNQNGKEIGEATLAETPHGVLIRLTLFQKTSNMASGAHALHIHEVGKCEPPFKSAGEHFNPGGQKHGILDKDGGHAGDLPNVHVTDNERLTVEFLAPQLSLGQGKNSLFDSDGSALVMHAKRDDYKTDPAGDAGDRIACGVIEKTSR
jgi:superoxide dismutase, Cu-Zn family